MGVSSLVAVTVLRELSTRKKQQQQQKKNPRVKTKEKERDCIVRRAAFVEINVNPSTRREKIMAKQH
jgi:hypothetical protein